MMFRGIFIILLFSLFFQGESKSMKIIDKSPKKSSDKRDVNKWKDWIQVSIDEMEGDTSYRSKDWLTISNDNPEKVIYVWMEKEGYDGSINVCFNVHGSGNCIDDNNRIIILFKDKTKIDKIGISKYNCDNNSWFSFEDEEIQFLKGKDIDKIRVYTREGSVQEEFSSKQSKEFLTIINHLIDRK